MELDRLIDAVDAVKVTGRRDKDIASVVFDSRQVRASALFAALPGVNADGRTFVEDAVGRGAVAILSEAEHAPHANVCYVQVRNVRRALAAMACAFYGHPSRKLKTVGITGTNGKTTSAYFTRDVLAAGDLKPGLIGTVQYEIGRRVIPADRTTPESVTLQGILAQMADAGCRSAVMEVSSHALVQDRVHGIDFHVAVFTNLTRDHLDYHGTVDAYFEAKARLFRELAPGPGRYAVLNTDDARGREVAQMPEVRDRRITFGLTPGVDVCAEGVRLEPGGSAYRARTPWGEAEIRLRLPGRYNVMNSLAALAAGGALGVDLHKAAAAVGALACVPGRLEEVPTNRGFQVFVDYAHTDDALANVLQAVRELVRHRLILVFGCGGNRDRTKRPAMGWIASRMADYTIVTSDNPRKEEPARIIGEIVAGMEPGARFEAVEERRTAIARALALAAPGDVVLVAGKGHETFQQFANTAVPFDDRQVVRELLGSVT
jgi:UDP-N-acetylmuramoyl-L-alanyl-D-glutamate--2,6-diaminopimelate ligase